MKKTKRILIGTISILLATAMNYGCKTEQYSERKEKVKVKIISDNQSTLSPKAIGNSSKDITLRIEGPGNPGSGVILGKKKDEYIGVTAYHVIKDINTGEEVDAITWDGKRHKFATGSIKRIAGVDLALFSFKSSKNYETAKIEKRDKSYSGDNVYVTGYPLITQSVSKPILRFLPGKIISNTQEKINGGYEILYTNMTLPGMSGGPVMSKRGGLIGIHGKAEVDVSLTKQKGVAVKTGTNQGIPVSYALEVLDPSSFVETRSSKSKSDALVAKAISIVNKINEYQQELAEAQKDNLLQNANTTTMMIAPAIRLINRAIELEPTNGYFYYIRGIQGQYGWGGEACNYFLQSAKYNAEIPDAYLQASKCSKSKNERSRYIERALEIDPEYAEAYLWKYKQEENVDNQLTILDEGIQASPLSSILKSEYGKLLITKSEVASNSSQKETLLRDALSNLERATILNPNSGFRVYQAKAETKRKLGLKEEALKDWDFILETAKRKLIWMYIAKAEIYLELDRKQDALTELTTAFSLDRNDKWNRMELPKAFSLHYQIARDLNKDDMACSSVEESRALEQDGVWNQKYSFKGKGWWTNNC